jgi:hypothetical protein
MSFGLNFESKKDKKEKEKNEDVEADEKKPAPYDGPEYVNFNLPWNFRFDYSLFYSNSYRPDEKTGIIKKTINQSLNFSGQLKLTDKWDMNMNTNFDIQALKFSFTTFSVSRSLHCWSMSFNFVPFGDRKSYSFNLSASSSILRDLKVSKQSSWRDN